ncbi:ATP-binding protein [Methylocucumis oryzae]|uniref:ATP-binding protein n=1 Tax=Methylocucumis oryzae TaxID=1632867 RepID=UPI000697A9F5|nr:ATP-binding protein [Methylocucumis oryzae]
MTLPRSLLARSAVLIASLIIVSQLITGIAFIYWVQLPRLQVISALAKSHLHSVRVSLRLLAEEKRAAYLQAAGHDFGMSILSEKPKLDTNDVKPPLVVDKFIQLYRNNLLPGESITYQAQPEPYIYVQISEANTPYWIRYEVKPFSTDFDKHWLGIIILLIFLAVLGGLVIHRALNKPLQRLADVVSRIGKGQRVSYIPEQGPDEIIAFIRALNRMNTDLKQLEADRNLMLAGISHDLRTPITRIQLALEMLGGDFDTDMKNRILANLAEIEGGLRQCLDFARDAGDEPTQSADLNELAHLCAASYKANGFEIALDLCEEAETVIRPFAMERLVRNLLDNAIKYAGVGIALATRIDGDTLYLSVLDRGKGIKNEDLEVLRRPFTRANAARGGTSGYGLGLAIVDKIIEAHKAHIEYLPREGGGLEVRIKLPRLTEAYD